MYLVLLCVCRVINEFIHISKCSCTLSSSFSDDAWRQKRNFWLDKLDRTKKLNFELFTLIKFSCTWLKCTKCSLHFIQINVNSVVVWGLMTQNLWGALYLEQLWSNEVCTSYSLQRRFGSVEILALLIFIDSW